MRFKNQKKTEIIMNFAGYRDLVDILVDLHHYIRTPGFEVDDNIKRSIDNMLNILGVVFDES